MYEINLGVVFLGRNQDFAGEVCAGLKNDRVRPLAFINSLRNMEATLKCLQPEILVIDDSFTEITAARLLQRIETLKDYIQPLIIVISGKNQARYVESCVVSGADYYVLKPFVAELFWERAIMLADNRAEGFVPKKIREAERGREGTEGAEERLLHRQIMELLYIVGCSPRLKGFVYLKEAIAFMVSNKSCKPLQGKDIYEAIGKKYRQSRTNIERTIHFAIQDIDPVAAKAYFNGEGATIVYDTNTITGMKFISLAAFVIAEKRKILAGGY